MTQSLILAQGGLPTLQVALMMAICTTLTSLVGFGIGYWYGKNNLRWQFKKLAKDASKLLPTVVEQLEAAENSVRRLQSLPKLNLTSNQTKQLEHKQSGLINSLTQLLTRVKPEPKPAQAVEEQLNSTLEWKQEPIDHSLRVPDSSTVIDNLQSMMKYLKDQEQTGGFLLLKMNKMATFKERFGPSTTEDLLKQLSTLAQASLRENDLLARLDDETICLYLPEADFETGTQLANQLRHTVRHGSFRLCTSDSEVLLTASFGFAFCQPTDTVDQVLNRALKTLKCSEGKGRNQLYVHSGKSAPRCITTS